MVALTGRRPVHRRPVSHVSEEIFLEVDHSHPRLGDDAFRQERHADAMPKGDVSPEGLE